MTQAEEVASRWEDVLTQREVLRVACRMFGEANPSVHPSDIREALADYESARHAYDRIAPEDDLPF